MDRPHKELSSCRFPSALKVQSDGLAVDPRRTVVDLVFPRGKAAMQTKEITIQTHLVPVRVGYAFVKHLHLHFIWLLCWWCQWLHSSWGEGAKPVHSCQPNGICGNHKKLILIVSSHTLPTCQTNSWKAEKAEHFHAKQQKWKLNPWVLNKFPVVCSIISTGDDWIGVLPHNLAYKTAIRHIWRVPSSFCGCLKLACDGLSQEKLLLQYKDIWMHLNASYDLVYKSIWFAMMQISFA